MILIKQLWSIADLMTSQRKEGFHKAAHWWTKDVQNAIRDVRAAQKAYRLFNIEHTWRTFQQAKDKQKYTA